MNRRKIWASWNFEIWASWNFRWDNQKSRCRIFTICARWVIYVHQYTQPASWRRIQPAEQVFSTLTYWFTDVLTPTELNFQPAERGFSLRYLHPAEWTVLQPAERVFSWRYLHPAESTVLQPAEWTVSQQKSFSARGLSSGKSADPFPTHLGNFHPAEWTFLQLANWHQNYQLNNRVFGFSKKLFFSFHHLIWIVFICI